MIVSVEMWMLDALIQFEFDSVSSQFMLFYIKHQMSLVHEIMSIDSFDSYVDTLKWMPYNIQLSVLWMNWIELVIRWMTEVKFSQLIKYDKIFIK